MIVELRDEELRQTSFVGIDLNKGSLLWKQDNLQEKWWIGLSATQKDFVLLHGYKDIKTPVHFKTYVLSAQNGKLLWKNESLKPIGFDSENLIVCQDEQSEDYLLLNPLSGAVVSDSPISSYKKSSIETLVINPDYYSVENKYFEKIAVFINSLTGLIPEAAVEYWEYKDKIISGFYIKKAEKLVNYILVANENGDVLLLDEIGQELNMASADTYFLVKGKLVYIKNKKELVIFEL